MAEIARLHLLYDRDGRVSPPAHQSLPAGCQACCLDIPRNAEPHELKSIALDLVNLLLKTVHPDHEERVKL
jgi:hypothetical protein